MNELIPESVFEAVQGGTARPGGPYPTRAEAVKAPPVMSRGAMEEASNGAMEERLDLDPWPTSRGAMEEMRR